MAIDAPTTAIGYVNQSYGSSTNNWWMYDGETTPELRWPQSVEVYDAMRTQDAQVGSVLEAVVRPILRTTWRLNPAGASSEVVEFCADDLGLPIVGENPDPPPRTKDRFSWLEHLELALLMLPFGHAYFEQIYRVDDDGNRAHLGKLEPRMPRTIDKIDVARDGGLISITQIGTMDYGMQRPIPVSRLVAYIYKREGGNWLGRSILRQAYKNWLIKDRLLRVQAQTIERNGMGIPVFTDAEGGSSADRTAGLAMAKALRSGEAAGVALGFGSSLELMGVSGTLPDAQPAIDYHDNQIARAVLAHFLNLGQQSGTGSYALGVTFADFFTASLQTLAQQIADTATQHIVEDLVDKNWGPKEPAPKITFDEIGSRQQATAQSIVALMGAGALTPDERLEESLRQQYGLPPKQPPDEQLLTEPLLAEGQEPESIEVTASAARDIDDDDDDEPGQFDVEVSALVAALADFTGEVWAAGKFNPDLHPRGGGGQFRTVFGRIQRALTDWENGDGDAADPLEGLGFTSRQLRDAAGKREVALRPRMSEPQIRKALLDDIRAKRAAKAGQPVRRASFTLKGKTHRDLDVGVYVENKPGSKIYLRRESGSKPSTTLASFDSLDDMAAWADEHGESELGDWARLESTGDAPKTDRVVAPSRTKKALDTAEARKAAKKTAPAGLTPREIEVENRIREAYRDIPRFNPAAYVGLADLRDRIGDDVPRAEVDAALRRLARDPRVRVDTVDMGSTFPWSGKKAPLGRRDHEAAVPFGDAPLHMIRFLDDPSPLPTPAKKATPRKAAPKATDFDARATKAAAGRDKVGAAVPVDLENEAEARRLVGDDGFDALHHYRGVFFDRINNSLRSDEAGASDDDTVRRVDTAMAASPIASDVVVYRGTKTGRGVFGDRLDGDLTGFEWREQSYASTATDQNVGKGYANNSQRPGVLMRVVVPGGTHGITMSEGEAELLLERGLTFRVVADHGVQPSGRFQHRMLDVEVVPAKATPRKAAPPAPGKAEPADLADALTTAKSRSEHLALIDGLSVAQLKQVAGEMGYTLPGSSKDAVKTHFLNLLELRLSMHALADPSLADNPALADIKKLTPAERLVADTAAKARTDALLNDIFGPPGTPDFGVTAPRGPTPDLSSLRTLDTEARRDALDERKVDDLKAMLREQGLKVSGRKRELVDRLVEHLGGGPAAPVTAPPADFPTPVIRPHNHRPGFGVFAQDANGKSVAVGSELPKAKADALVRRLKAAPDPHALVEELRQANDADVAEMTAQRRAAAEALDASRRALKRADLQAMPLPQLRRLAKAHGMNMDGADRSTIIDRLLRS